MFLQSMNQASTKIAQPRRLNTNGFLENPTVEHQSDKSMGLFFGDYITFHTNDSTWSFDAHRLADGWVCGSYVCQ
jgi:hypothetical protein